MGAPTGNQNALTHGMAAGALPAELFARRRHGVEGAGEYHRRASRQLFNSSGSRSLQAVA